MRTVKIFTLKVVAGSPEKTSLAFFNARLIAGRTNRIQPKRSASVTRPDLDCSLSSAGNLQEQYVIMQIDRRQQTLHAS